MKKDASKERIERVKPYKQRQMARLIAIGLDALTRLALGKGQAQVTAAGNMRLEEFAGR